jgi:hypothetical protein
MSYFPSLPDLSKIKTDEQLYNVGSNLVYEINRFKENISDLKEFSRSYIISITSDVPMINKEEANSWLLSAISSREKHLSDLELKLKELNKLRLEF